ncbi:MAG: glycosyltransferase family 4 protein [Pyrinomonadaceae bacterium]
MPAQNTIFLLDSAPRNWCSQQDRHLEICKALIARGGRAVIVFSSALPPEIESRFREAGIELATISYASGIYYYLKALDELVEKYQITTAHIIFFDYFSAISWIAKTRRLKYVVYEMQNGGIFRAQSLKRSLLQMRNKLALFPTSKVIAISNFIKEQLMNGGVKENKIVVRHLGIDTNRFKPDPSAQQRLKENYGIQPDELILSTVQYLRPIKNPQTIVQACGELAKRNLRAHLFVAGDGEMLEELQALSRRLGIADRTHWLGLVPDPTSLLQASDLFILSTVGEAFGLVLAESMACGVPVVGSRSGGIPEVVVDGETGLLVPPLEPELFADAIAQLGRDTEMRSRLSRQAIKRVREQFSMEKTVGATMRIYESLWND